MKIEWIGLALAMTVALPAAAQDRIVDISDPAVVVQVLQEEGYKAALRTGENGSPIIGSAANGSSFDIQFYGCKQGKACTSLDFYSWYKKKPWFDAAFANRWNDSKRFIKASIDEDGDLATYMYASTLGKTTYANFADSIDWWSTMTGELQKFLDAEDTKANAPGAAKQ